MPKFETVKVGDVLCEIAVRRGERSWFSVEVKSIDPVQRTLMGYSSGRVFKYHEDQIKRMQRNPPKRRK